MQSSISDLSALGPMSNHILHSRSRNQASLDLYSSLGMQVYYSNNLQAYLVMQVYYDYSPVCKAAASEWEQAAKDLSQWARLGRIEWNQQYLLSNLRSFMGLAIRPDDLPVVFGFPTKCHSMACAVRCTCYRPTHAMPTHVYPKHMHACMFMIQEARVYWQCCVQQTMQILYASTIAVPGDSWQPFAHLLQTMQTRYVPSTAVPGVPLPAIASCHASIVFKLP